VLCPGKWANEDMVALVEATQFIDARMSWNVDVIELSQVPALAYTLHACTHEHARAHTHSPTHARALTHARTHGRAHACTHRWGRTGMRSSSSLTHPRTHAHSRTHAHTGGGGPVWQAVQRLEAAYQALVRCERDPARACARVCRRPRCVARRECGFPAPLAPPPSPAPLPLTSHAPLLHHPSLLPPPPGTVESFPPHTPHPWPPQHAMRVLAKSGSESATLIDALHSRLALRLFHAYPELAPEPQALNPNP